nr:hypothetical protein [Methanobacterium formicicum]
MKLKFDPNLEYQDEAISAIVDLFEGQNSMQSYFTVPGVQVGLYDAGQGIGNRLEISNDDILENLKKSSITEFFSSQ